MSRIMEPTRIAQGERSEWTRTFDDYPASKWTLEYRFAGPSTRFVVATSADGDAFNAAVSTAQSSTAAVGRWMWQAWATATVADDDFSIGDVRMIGSGFTQVDLGLSHAGTDIVETRSPNKIMLDSIDAALKVSGDVVKYEVSTPAGTRMVQRQLRSEAIELRKYYAGLVAREDAAERSRRTGKFGRSINVRIFDND